MQQEEGLIAQGFRAARERDLSSFLGIVTPDVRFRPAIVGAVEGREYHGHDGVREWWGIAFETWDVYEPTVEAEIAIASHHLAISRIVVRGRGSRLPVTQRIAVVATARGNRLSRVHVTTDLAEGLEEMARLVRED